MTTAELVSLIEADNADHRRHDCHEAHPWTPEHTTLNSLYQRAGVARRYIEEAVQQARLEGIPIITDGGVRVATTAVEAFALHRWLRHRLATQTRTAWAVRSAAMLMARGESKAPRAVSRPPEPVYVEVPLWSVEECAA